MLNVINLESSNLKQALTLQSFPFRIQVTKPHLVYARNSRHGRHGAVYGNARSVYEGLSRQNNGA